MSPHFGVVQETLVRSVYTSQRHASGREAPRDSSLVGTVRVGVFQGKEEEVARIARGPTPTRDQRSHMNSFAELAL